MCSCPFGLLPPQCLQPVPPRLCDPLNASDVPSATNNCAFCYVAAPAGTASGCFNGGTCYYQPTSGLPVPGRALCGCSYYFAPPTCVSPSSPKRICNATVPTDAPPNCEYCHVTPGLTTANNGCHNYGFCSLQTLVRPGLPPNFQTPICTCQVGMVGANCYINFFQAFGRYGHCVG